MVKWLYTHIVTRTFGVSDTVTFIPFAEFLNHGYFSSHGEYVYGHSKQSPIDDETYFSDDSYTSSQNMSTGT